MSKKIRSLYLANESRVRNLFVGFFTPGLIDRLCVDLFHGQNDLPYLETKAQRDRLRETLLGVHVGYNPHLDPELTTEQVRRSEKEAWY